jgi:hypothetical protein
VCARLYCTLSTRAAITRVSMLIYIVLELLALPLLLDLCQPVLVGLTCTTVGDEAAPRLLRADSLNNIQTLRRCAVRMADVA